MTTVTGIGLRFAESSLLMSVSRSRSGKMLVARHRLVIPALCAVGCLVFITSGSSAQLSPQERRDVVATLASEINRAIQKQDDFPYLRDKVVRRVAECAFLFKALANASPEPELKNNFLEVSRVSQEVTIFIAEALPAERYKTIISDAHYSTTQISKRDYRRQVGFLQRSCMSLNEVNEIDQAVRELTF
jgi:hypothetical protein